MNGPVEQSESCSHSDCSHDGHNHQAQASAIASGHEPEGVFSRVVGFMDIAGVFASTLCTVHCLLVPVIVILLPVFASHLMHHDYVHIGLAGFVLTFCLMAFIPGYLKHNDKRLIYLGIVGVSLVFFATFVARSWGEGIEATIITLGNAFIISGHLLNRKLLAHLKCQHHK